MGGGRSLRVGGLSREYGTCTYTFAVFGTAHSFPYCEKYDGQV